LEPTDRDLVTRARDGDRGAFHTLVDRHASRLYEVAAMMIGNTTDAQDIVQETLLGAFQGLRRFEARSSVKTWLSGILIRQVALFWRRGSLRHSIPIDALVNDPSVATPGATDHADARLDLAALLSKLSDEHREVIVLREIDGLSYDEMAEALGLPRGTVESRLFRARQLLKELAGPSGFPGR